MRKVVLPRYPRNLKCTTEACARSNSVELMIRGVFRRPLTKRLENKYLPYAAGNVEISSSEDDSRALWWKAIKLPIFTVALIPLFTGAAAAFLETGYFAGGSFGCFALGGMMVIAWLNLSNDGWDAETSVDLDKKESVVNLTGGNKEAVLKIAHAFLLGGVALLAYAGKAAGDVRVAWMLVAAIAIGHIYQGPPFRLSYKGLGEPLCFCAFGPLATNAFFLAQGGAAAAAPIAFAHSALAASILVGITTSVILFCSHFHQVAGDTAAGKRSPVVRLGVVNASKVLFIPVVAIYGFAVAFVAAGWLPMSCVLLYALTIPTALQLLNFVRKNHLVPEKVAPAKIYATKWHTLTGVMLSIGLALPRLRVMFGMP